jgi:hypothetical protein
LIKQRLHSRRPRKNSRPSKESSRNNRRKPKTPRTQPQSKRPLTGSKGKSTNFRKHMTSRRKLGILLLRHSRSLLVKRWPKKRLEKRRRRSELLRLLTMTLKRMSRS